MQKTFDTAEAAAEYRRNQEALDRGNYWRGNWPEGPTVEQDGLFVVRLRKPLYAGD